MPDTSPPRVPHPIPLMGRNEEQLVKLRKQLEGMFTELHLVLDVTTVCNELTFCKAHDFSPEMTHVLRRCAINRLHGQMKVLTGIVERFGGRTDFSNPTTGKALPIQSLAGSDEEASHD